MPLLFDAATQPHLNRRTAPRAYKFAEFSIEKNFVTKEWRRRRPLVALDQWISTPLHGRTLRTVFPLPQTGDYAGGHSTSFDDDESTSGAAGVSGQFMHRRYRQNQ
jgi:hypothetical protein